MVKQASVAAGQKPTVASQSVPLAAMRAIVADTYSEYLLNPSPKPTEGEKEQPVRQPPDAGLGMIFRYPGDARKLRDRSKMRLWAEYFRGRATFFPLVVCFCNWRGLIVFAQRMVGM